METKLITLTPDLARDLLAKNGINRRVRPLALLKYKKAILNGEYRLTHQGIAIDWFGNLIDGQHRCLAVVETGMPVPILLSKNVDPETFKVVDTGSARSAKDGINSVNRNVAAAATRLILSFESGISFGGDDGTISHTKVINRFNEDELLQQSTELFGGRRPIGIKLSSTFVVAGYYLTRKSDEILAHAFFRCLVDGQGLYEGDVVYALRKRLLYRLTRYEIGPLILKAWKYFKLAKDLKYLKADCEDGRKVA